LVIQGHRPHAITVDLIYAAIGQGSRTTINDELKRWKDEKARAEALEADLPPVVADGMRALWVVAVEQAERVFEERRGDLESQLGKAQEELNTVQAAYQRTQAASEITERLLREQISTLSQQLTDVREQLAAETAAKNDALGHTHALSEELGALRRESTQQLESVRQEQEKQAAAFQEAITARDAAFRAELATATERLESAQGQMLQQIDNARQWQRRAETQAAQLQQQRDQLQGELAELKMQFGVQAHELNQRSAALDKATASATRWAAERQTLITDLANSRGRIEGIEHTVLSLEARAVAAETRLGEALRQRDAKPHPRKRAGATQD
jgi:chromosome segregation ATPase